MEIRNQEDRNAAIWRFTAFAAVLALLLLLGGFSMGHTFKTHGKGCEENLRQASEQAAEQEKRISQGQLFFQKNDSLVAALEVKIEELDIRLKEVGADPDQDRSIITGVDNDMFELRREFDRSMKTLEADFPPYDSADLTLKIGRKYFREYSDQYFNRINKRLKEMLELSLQGQGEELQEKLDELDKKGKEMEEKAGAAALQADKDDLQRQLNQCEKDLAKCQQPAASSGGGGAKDFSKETAKILGEVEAIKKEIIPKIPEGLLGKKKGLKEELRGYLDAIAGAAKEIK